MKVCEKIKNYGPLPLSNTELIEILLGTNGAKKLQTLLNQYDLKDVDLNDDSNSNVLKIASLDYDRLKHRGALTDLETSRIMAAIELGLRIACAEKFESQYFAPASHPYQTVKYLLPRMGYLSEEIFVVLALNSKNKIIGSKIISKGSATGTIVDPKAVFNYALLSGCVAIIVAHNHPSSGDPNPSQEDVNVTHLLYSAGIVMNLPLLDHLIIGSGGSYYSFQENGTLIPPTDSK